MRELLSVRVFHRLAAAFVLAELIEWFALITLAVVVYDQTSDALATTALFASTKLIPSLAVPVLAARTDRWATTRGIGVLFALEAVLFAGLAGVILQFSLLLICVLALVDGCVAALIRAYTRAAVATTMEPRGLLREANAALNLGFALMNIVGPATAGLAVGLLDPSVVMLIGAGLLVFAAVFVGSDTTRVTVTGDEAGWMRRIREAVAYLRRQPVTLLLILGEGLVMMFGTLVAPIEVVYAKESLDAGPEAYAALAAAWGAGITVGSLVFARVGRRHLAASLVASTAVMGAGITIMAGAPTLLVACAAAMLGGTGNGIQWVSAVTALQESVSAEMQVRVAGFFEAVVTLVPGIGYLLGGAITEATSPRVAFLVAGLGILAAALAGAAAFLVHRRAPGRLVTAPRRVVPDET